MDRTIKFRVWDMSPDDNEMRYVDLYWFEEHMIRAWPNHGPWAGNYKLMQFTSLHDKNGKEIYEGDIIHDPLTGKRYPVVFENGAFRTNGLVECNAFPNDEVIGNIYENPDLLTV